MNAARLPAVEIDPGAAAMASVIWLHGLGADGHDFESIVPELRLPTEARIRFVFPHAPERPITINGGYVMRAWYDIIALGPGQPEDKAGIEASEHLVRGLIAHEKERGVPSEQIVLAGFSQGGAIALRTALGYPERLAGVLALSTYLPLAQRAGGDFSSANAGLPIFMAHGLWDQVIPLVLAEGSRQILMAHGYPVEWHIYPMPHSVCAEEIGAIRHFLVRVLEAT
jgi:Predicted esterase